MYNYHMGLLVVHSLWRSNKSDDYFSGTNWRGGVVGYTRWALISEVSSSDQHRKRKGRNVHSGLSFFGAILLSLIKLNTI